MSLGSPWGPRVPKGTTLGKALVLSQRTGRDGNAASDPVSAGRRAARLPCSAPWLPVLRAEAIWWVLVASLIFVPFISFHNPPQAWLFGETMGGGRSQW